MFRFATRAALLLMIFVSMPVAAATRYVGTTGFDADNDCSDQSSPCLTVQYAVDQADAGDSVSIGAGSYAGNVRIRKSLTLNGAGGSGSNATTITGIEQSAPSIHIDGIDTAQAVNVVIENLGVSGNLSGDGIYIDAAQATITDSFISGNGHDGIALNDDAHASIINSVIANNEGDGIDMDGSVTSSTSTTGCIVSDNAGGGIVIETGSAIVQSSTIDGNTGAGIVLDGPDAKATVSNSTVSNTVPFSGRGGPAFGGGVLIFGGSATIQTSTLFGNTGQGILLATEVAVVAVQNSTISGTKSAADDSFVSGGVVVDANAPVAQAAGAVAGLALTATIIAQQATNVPDCSAATLTDGGYNLADDGSCALTGTGSLSQSNPNLGPLADNGGPTMTLLPGTGSPAINAIPDITAACADNATDQRGIARPQPSGGACDIGSVEVQAGVAVPPAEVTPVPTLDLRALLLLTAVLTLLAVTRLNRRGLV